MTEDQFKQLTQQLASIELPPEPNWWPLLGTVIGIVIALTIIALLMRKKNSAQHNTRLADAAPQRLKHIQQQWQDGVLDQRSSAYQLATLLRIALGLKQLDHHTPESLRDQHAQWQATITLLQQLRYQTGSNAQLDEQTFATIRSWLKC